MILLHTAGPSVCPLLRLVLSPKANSRIPHNGLFRCEHHISRAEICTLLNYEGHFKFRLHVWTVLVQLGCGIVNGITILWYMAIFIWLQVPVRHTRHNNHAANHVLSTEFLPLTEILDKYKNPRIFSKFGKAYQAYAGEANFMTSGQLALFAAAQKLSSPHRFLTNQYFMTLECTPE